MTQSNLDNEIERVVSKVPHIMEMVSVKRYQHYLDTGDYPDGVWSKTWDMLTWIEYQKNGYNQAITKQSKLAKAWLGEE